MSAPNAAALASLAGWIEDKLSSEHADRQTICEDAAAQLRDMAAALRASSGPGDSRIQYAQEYLNGARNRPVPTLPPSVMMRELAETRRQLGIVLHVLDSIEDAGTDEDGAEPYCTTCGQWAGMFVGVDGWRHYRGDPAPGGVRELYDPGHEPVIGWTVPPGRALAPGGMAVVLDALADAAEYRRYMASQTCETCAQHPAELCGEHQADLDAADAYDQLADQIRKATP